MNIAYTLNITPVEALNLISALVEEVDYLNWKGNENGGEASGKGFAGRYTTKACSSGSKLQITIDKKHPLGIGGVDGRSCGRRCGRARGCVGEQKRAGCEFFMWS